VSRSKKASKPSSKGARERVKDLPWALLLQAAVVIGNRWRALSEKDRARLTRIVRESQGRPARLGPRERVELRRLAGKLDVKRMARELMLLARVSGNRRRRRRA
jgi:hypothetical protein